MSPCIVSWISSPGGYKPRQISDFVNKHKISVKNWTTELDKGSWANKIGYIATEPNATLTLKFDNIIQKDVEAVTIYFIKSYGEKWKDSRANFTISADEVDGKG